MYVLDACGGGDPPTTLPVTSHARHPQTKTAGTGRDCRGEPRALLVTVSWQPRVPAGDRGLAAPCPAGDCGLAAPCPAGDHGLAAPCPAGDRELAATCRKQRGGS